MNNKTLGRDPLYGFLHTEVEGVDALAKLALDIRWSWNHAADEIWEQCMPPTNYTFEPGRSWSSSESFMSGIRSKVDFIHS